MTIWITKFISLMKPLLKVLLKPPVPDINKKSVKAWWYPAISLRWQWQSSDQVRGIIPNHSHTSIHTAHIVFPEHTILFMSDRTYIIVR